jgi:hypothetical protein
VDVKKAEAELKTEAVRTLELFIVHARRMEEHSLASDRNQLLAWANIQIHDAATANIPSSAKRSHLKSSWNCDFTGPTADTPIEPIYYAKVLNVSRRLSLSRMRGRLLVGLIADSTSMAADPPRLPPFLALLHAQLQVHRTVPGPC